MSDIKKVLKEARKLLGPEGRVMVINRVTDPQDEYVQAKVAHELEEGRVVRLWEDDTVELCLKNIRTGVAPEVLTRDDTPQPTGRLH